MKPTCACLVLVSLVVATASLAQQPAATEPTAKPADSDSSDSRPTEAKSLEERLAAQEQKVEQLEAAHEKELAKAKAELQGQLDELKTELEKKSAEDTAAELFAEPPDGEVEQQRVLNIHGFFDVSFTKHYLEKHSLAKGYVTTSPSFMMSNINLYIDSQMTQTLGTSLELKFSYLPYGYEKSLNVYIDDSPNKVASYDRVNTLQADPFSTQVFATHSVSIERAQLIYTPRDWFKLILGKYLTPYGIWNVDHGSTVVITAHTPYLLIRNIIPQSQLGLQCFGRLFFKEDVFLDYSFTVSNGRADFWPTDSGDLNANKALGGGLALSIDKLRWSVRSGAYVFGGKNSDIEKNVNVDTESNRILVDVVEIESVREIAVSTYLLVELMGLRLQGEFVWNRGDYEIPGRISPADKLTMTSDPTGESYYASYIARDAYALLAYQLPLERWLGQVRILPFVLYEYNQSMDTKPFLNFQFLVGGLNVRPSPWIALKLEYAYAIPESSWIGNKAYSLTAQVAVSF